MRGVRALQKPVGARKGTSSQVSHIGKSTVPGIKHSLAVYAILQLAGQMLSAVCSLSVIIAIFENTGYLLSIIASVWAVTVDILGLSGPICLLMTR